MVKNHLKNFFFCFVGKHLKTISNAKFPKKKKTLSKLHMKKHRLAPASRSFFTLELFKDCNQHKRRLNQSQIEEINP